MLSASAMRLLGEPDRAAAIAEDVAARAKLWGVRSFALGTLGAARLDEGRVLDALAALNKLMASQPAARLRGGHDLEIRATAIRVMRAAGLDAEADKMLEKARAITARQTAHLDEDAIAQFYRSPLIAGLTPRT